MLLKVTGDAMTQARMQIAGVEPLVVVDPMAPFTDPMTCRKIAGLVGEPNAVNLSALGITLYQGAQPGIPINMNQSPDEQGLRTGSCIFMGREERAVVQYPIASPSSFPGFPHPSIEGMAISPSAKAKSVAWDVSSQMEEAAAKKRAQQIMEDFLRNKKRVQELEAEVLTLNDQLSNKDSTVSEMFSRLKDQERMISTAANGETDDLKKENYSLKRDILELRKANTLFDRRDRETNLEIEKLQVGVEAAEESGRLESKKKMKELIDEIAEANAFIDALKERLIAQSADIQKLSLNQPAAVHTEHIILPPGMLRKLVTVSGTGMQYYRDKYSVDIELLDNTLTATGDPANVKLLKEECEARLLGKKQSNHFDPNSSGGLVPAEMDQNLVDQFEKRIDNLQGELTVAHGTIESLHIALMHAQQRVEEDMSATKQLREISTNDANRKISELEQQKKINDDLRAELTSKSAALDEANAALQSTIETFQLEYERQKGSKEENNMLRTLLETREGELSNVNQEVFLLKEQLSQLTQVNVELQNKAKDSKVTDDMVPILQAAVTELRSEKEKMLIETARRCEDWGAEKGSLLERNSRVQEALDSAVTQLAETKRLREETMLSRLREDELTAKLAVSSAEGVEVRRLLEDNARQAQEIAELKAAVHGTAAAAGCEAEKAAALARQLEGERMAAMVKVNARERELIDLKVREAVAAAAQPPPLPPVVASPVMADVDKLKSEMHAATLSTSATPSLPAGHQATAIVDAIRMELESKKLQLSNLLIDRSVSPSRMNDWDLSPAKPISPSSTHRGSPSSPPTTVRKPTPRR